MKNQQNKIPMTFETFKKYMDIIYHDYTIQERIYEASERSIELLEVFSSLSAVTDLLSYIFCDEEDDWIGYYCWELDMGRDYKPGMITDKDGKDIPLGTVYDLYELLMDNYKTYHQN